jgi:hypothetical protein
MTEIAAIRTGIEQISTMVEAARRLVMEGHLVDLRSLEARVETFCTALRNAPAEAADQLRPTMLGLIDELSRLDAAVRASQTETAAKLGETLARRRAVTAYGGGALAPTTPRPGR